MQSSFAGVRHASAPLPHDCTSTGPSDVLKEWTFGILHQCSPLFNRLNAHLTTDNLKWYNMSSVTLACKLTTAYSLRLAIDEQEKPTVGVCFSQSSCTCLCRTVCRTVVPFDRAKYCWRLSAIVSVRQLLLLRQQNGKSLDGQSGKGRSLKLPLSRLTLGRSCCLLCGPFFKCDSNGFACKCVVGATYVLFPWTTLSHSLSKSTVQSWLYIFLKAVNDARP